MQIPLERVERVEILHGGTGSVLYGDNAVGGVINIITKTGKTKKPSYEFYTSGGSYNMNKQSFSCDGDTERLSYSLTTARLDTNGYRQNSEFRSNDFGTKLKYQASDTMAMKLSGDFHEADLGLPGPLNKEEYATLSRRDSTANERDNNVGEQDYYVKWGIEGSSFNLGIFNLDFSFRRRTSDSYFPNWWTPTISKAWIDTFAVTPNYTCTMDIFGRPNKIIAGIDFYKTDNKINDYNTSTNVQSNDNDIDKNSLGFYISDSFDITDKLSIDLAIVRATTMLNYIDITGPANNMSSDQEKRRPLKQAWYI
jgi:iron complex outermembrane receptor protein